MTGTGARGPTAAQIARTLHLRGPRAFEALGSLQRAIAAGQAVAAHGDAEAPTLDLADALFLQRGFPVLPSFTSGLQQHFGAFPESVDFSGDPTGALNAINGWASEHTEGIIPRLLESVPPDTVLTLVNAVYLKAAWLFQFNPSKSAPAPFHNRAGATTAEFMHEIDHLRFGSGPGYKAVELPYRSSNLSLLVVLPKKQSLGALQYRLDARGLAHIVHSLSLRTVRLSLPRFHLSTQVALNDALKSLGMTLPFTGSANFTGIAGAGGLYIDLVEHAADFNVEETGTVAAAATAVRVRKSRPRRATFKANHPFLFFLRDDATGAVLFAGRVIRPESAGG